MNLRVTIAVLIAAGAAGAAWWTLRSDDSSSDEATVAAESAAPHRQRVAALPTPVAGADSAKPVVPTIDFQERLPEEYRPAAVNAAVADFQDWLASKYPAGDVTFLGADCATPPCMLGLSFSGEGFSDAEHLRAFYADSRAELERRVGFPMTTVHADEDRGGRQFMWMYGIPADAEAELAQALRGNAEARHAARMYSKREPTPPAVPGPGEPGYDGE